MADIAWDETLIERIRFCLAVGVPWHEVEQILEMTDDERTAEIAALTDTLAQQHDPLD